MTKLACFTYGIRVWREEPVFKLGPDPEVMRVAGQALQEHYQNPEKIVGILAALPRVSGVELLDAHGNGACVYPDWP